MSRYEPVVGLEVHAELLTSAKMFCGCRVVDSVTAEPNSAVCPICLGMPGMLPVANRRAVTFAIRVALALNCEIQRHNIFARKNYFYPDLPKGYQISQYELPLARHGWLNFSLDSGEMRRVGIRRVHMEEDTGKLTHVERLGTLVDYNRSGVPLLEIVTEPDLHAPEEVYACAQRLRQILRYLEVNSGDLEKGVLRVEPNISVRPAGSSELGTRTEVKNLNSFRALAAATAYEVARQSEIVDEGGSVEQETRGWSEARRETFPQRRKEEADDYRYFPEPDLPPLEVDAAWIEAVRAKLPELPGARVQRYISDFGLSPYDSAVLTEERATAEWFEAAVAAGGEPGTIANWIGNEIFALLNQSRQTIEEIQVTPVALVELIDLIEDGTLSHSAAREVLGEMFATGEAPLTLVREKGLAQISDEAALAGIIAQVLDENPEQVETFLGGKEGLRGWFVGQVMRATRGKANPQVVQELLARELDGRR
ncbi:MAG: Asp-tRNA(Asn)/Glu-tRNA(Gln) amidotransferase subunit GatB [Candidatus Promineifilaceae bacterium]|nr:Asp-tRNA(Asn)/Glu-tRNA(Gln) amidotransferase subunit GatB [Candidatus Promineifilaceae bacterium]